MSYYENHKEKKKAYAKAYKKNHPEKTKEWSKDYRIKHAEEIRRYNELRREKTKEYNRSYFLNNRDKYREHEHTYRKRNPYQKMLRSAVGHMVDGVRKKSKSWEYIGCSPQFLKNHIEYLFKDGMSWENWGLWHLDHIVPLSWFPIDLDSSLLFVASHWTNLRPIWKMENLRKSNRYAEVS